MELLEEDDESLEVLDDSDPLLDESPAPVLLEAVLLEELRLSVL